jgi:hypothetical protein
MSGHWDINRDEDLRELVESLIITSGPRAPQSDQRWEKAKDNLDRYRRQVKVKGPKIDGGETISYESSHTDKMEKEKPFLIGDYVRSKYSDGCKGCVSGFLKDGIHMSLTNGGLYRIDSFELDETENDRIIKKLEQLKNKRILIRGQNYYGRYCGEYCTHEDRYISDNSFVQVYLKDIDCGGNMWVTIRNHKDIFEEEEKSSYENQKETIEDLHKRNKYLMDTLRTTVEWFVDRTRDNRELMNEWDRARGVLNGCDCIHPPEKNPPKEE